MSVSSPSAAPANAVAPFDLESFFYRWTQSPLLTVAIVLLAGLQQAAGHVNSDDSWFMTFAEAFLAGKTPYIDISDPNPPAAFLAYVPSILMGQALGLPPDIFLTAITFAMALLSLLIAGTILKRSGLVRPQEMAPAMAATAFALLIVPALCFAEREHFAIIALLPMLALCMVRAEGLKTAAWLALLAGTGAGLAVAFKLYYALPLGLAILCVVFRQRSMRLILTPEIFATEATLALYGAMIVQFFPAYLTQALPLAADVYLPARESLPNILKLPHFLATAGLLAALLITARGRFKDSRILVLIAASFGFLVTFLIQSKGWMNHSYPGLALALLASVFFLLAETGAQENRRRQFALFIFVPLLCVAPMLFGASADWRNEEEHPGLKAAVARLAPAHPKIAALAEELDLGHPVVRQLGGTWVGRQNCLWVSYAVKYLLAQGVNEPRRSRLLHYKDADEAMFADDVRGGQPDVLLVETPELEAWARREPNLAGIFDAYRLAGRVEAVSIWLRDTSVKS